MSIRRRLLLFDIDGTLLHTGGAGVSAIYEGMKEAFDLRDSAGQMPALELAGATDAGLAHFLFDHFEIDHTPDNEESFYDAYHRNLTQNLAHHCKKNGGNCYRESVNCWKIWTTANISPLVC